MANYPKNRLKWENPEAGTKRYEYRGNAKRRGITFDLTQKQFLSLWEQPCAYCGGEVHKIGIDRVNNSVGYIISNVVSCCPQCNRLKGKLSRDKFLRLCKQIVQHTS